jgi:energy-coupling factor transporter ATP-binding protein EcfA2
MTQTFILTADQNKALDAMNNFIVDPIETVFVLSGYSGCGKSTLVRTFLAQLPKFMEAYRLIFPEQKVYEPVLTATTNKAAENLSFLTNDEVRTIHSYLGLRVDNDFRKGTTSLTVQRNTQPKEGILLFIDEASFINPELLQYIFQLTKNCKIIFIGDPAQLTPVKSAGTPVFEAKFKGAELTEVVRQPKPEGGMAELHPITAWAEQLRNTVKTGIWTPFKPDGFHIQRLSTADFKAKAIEEFSKPGWHFSDSRILAWTNNCVIDYNKFMREQVKGDPHFAVGDYAVCNSFITVNKTFFKTDEMVYISGISEDEEQLGVLGNFFELNNKARVFQPKTLSAKNEKIKHMRSAGNIQAVAEIEMTWADLRAIYANTINKSQGSTYGSVFIDLDDVRRCNSGDQLARMMYVGISRAKNHVYLKGDLA